MEQLICTELQEEDIYFCYEPIVLTINGKTVAYEQLARMHNKENNAFFLTQLSEGSRLKLDIIGFKAAIKRILATGINVTINIFPENLECIISLVLKENSSILSKLGIEVHETISNEIAIPQIKKHPEIWWLLDDFTSRECFAMTVMNQKFRNISITAKLPWEHTPCLLKDDINIDAVPSSWVLIAEGARNEDLSKLFRKGILLAQGREIKESINDNDQIKSA